MTLRRYRFLFLPALFVMALLPMPSQSAEIAFRDDFEKASLDASKWSTYRVPDRRHWIDRHTVYRGTGVLAIRVKGSDIQDDCQCQQSEVREAGNQRINFGEEAWYQFTFRLQGNWPPAGGQRWVIGGWKQETDGSAFVAQRFDRGVFHITLESGRTRVLLASNGTNADGFLASLGKGLLQGFEYISDTQRYEGNSDVKIVRGADPDLPDPATDWVTMTYRIRGGLNGNGLVEVYANGKFIARATGTIGVREMGGPTQYFKIGHNRHPMPGSATLYVDNFRRGATRADVSDFAN